MSGEEVTPGETERGARILVVDDEHNVRDLVAMGLRYQGFTVATAVDGPDALGRVPEFRPDLIVLDVLLPGLDGFEVCRRLGTGEQRPPIVFLSARRELADRLTGLTIGGDDYLTKPFSLEELFARIRVVLRRAAGPGGPAGPDRPGEAAGGRVRLRVADLELDEASCEAWRHGVRLELTPTEFRLLRYLMINTGQVVTKAQILDQVWSYSFDGTGAIVETYIYYLRRKLGSGSSLIRTVRGFGYSLRPAE